MVGSAIVDSDVEKKNKKNKPKPAYVVLTTTSLWVPTRQSRVNSNRSLLLSWKKTQRWWLNTETRDFNWTTNWTRKTEMVLLWSRELYFLEEMFHPLMTEKRRVHFLQARSGECILLELQSQSSLLKLKKQKKKVESFGAECVRKLSTTWWPNEKIYDQ